MKFSNLKMRTKLLVIGLVPLVISTIAVMIITVISAKTLIDSEQEVMLQAALEGFEDNVEMYKEQGIDLTVFEGDTRVESSIKSAIGTKASEVVIEKVLKEKETYFDTNVNVNGEPYYGYYIPTEEGMLFAGKSKVLIDENINGMIISAIVGCVVFIIISGGAIFAIALKMSKQIKGIESSLSLISNGDLTVDIDESLSRDEIGKATKATGDLIEKLKMVMNTTSNIGNDVSTNSKDLQRVSNTTLNAMNEVSRAIEEISIGLNGQSMAVQQISENLYGMNEDVTQIKSCADMITDCATALNSSSELMKGKMSDMHDSNIVVNDNITDISKKIKEISEAIENVKTMADTIESISRQTNLLSLNANIEAARAGEAGMGFAVVATSIRDLSEDTRKEVDEIRAMITGLVEDFGECFEIIEETVRNSTTQKAEIANVLEEFNILANEISNTSERAAEINGAIEKSIHEMLEINNKVEDLTSISENSAASTQEVNASVEEINALMNTVADDAVALEEKSGELSVQLKYWKLK